MLLLLSGFFSCPSLRGVGFAAAATAAAATGAVVASVLILC